MSANIWDPGTGIIQIDAETSNLSQVFTTTEAQASFTLTSFSYVVGSNSIAVYRSGQRLIKDADWAEVTGGTSISILISLAAGEIIEVVAVLGASAPSAAAAAASAAEAAGYLTQFQYLGSHAENPLVDNEGNPVVEGMLYWNSAVNEMRIYDGASWTVAYVPSGGYVTETGAQTLTNKTIDYAENTILNLPPSNPFSSNVALAQVQATALCF